MENYSGQQIKRLKSCILHHQGDKGCNQGKQCTHLLSPSLSIISWSLVEKGLEQSRDLAWAAEFIILQSKPFHQTSMSPFVFPCLTGRPPKLCTQAAPGLTLGLATSAAQTGRNPLAPATADTRSLSEGWDASLLLRGNLFPQAFSALHCTHLAGASPGSSLFLSCCSPN